QLELERDALARIAGRHEVLALHGGRISDGLPRQPLEPFPRGEQPQQTPQRPRARRPPPPHTPRWSTVHASVHAGRASTFPSTTSARGAITPSAIVTACPGFSSGVPYSDPYDPVFETAIVAPVTSPCESVLARAASARRAISAPIAAIP